MNNNCDLLLQSSEPGTRYNIQLMNALVLYVGTQAIQFIHGKGLTPSMSTIAHSAHMDIFQNLAVALDTEGNTHFPVHFALQEVYVVELCVSILLVFFRSIPVLDCHS